MTNTPHFVISRENKPLGSLVQEHLTGFRLSQLLSAPSQLELTWQAGVGSDLPRFDLGEELSVSAEGHTLFAGSVSAVEVSKERDGRAVLSVRAYDRLEALRRQSRVRTLKGTEFARVLSELCEPLRVTVEGFEGPAVATLTQGGRTDFEFMRELTLARGCYFHLDGDRLVGFRLRAGGPRVSKAWGDFWTCRCERNARRAHGRVKVLGGTLAQAGVFRAEAQTEGMTSTGSTEQHRLGHSLHSDAEAEGLAQALAERAAASAAVFRAAIIPGELHFRPGVTIDLKDIPGSTDQSFVLTQVTHVYDGQEGFRTELSSALPADDAVGRINQVPVVVGEVKELDSRGRVRVYFPTHDALSDWLRVVTAGAGGQKGLAFLPDVGDEVVVLSPDGDPVHGVVLGGLWDEGPEDAGVASGRRRRAEWRLAKQHISIDADRNRMELANGAGAKLVLEKQSVRLDASGGTLALTNGQGSQLELTGSVSRLSSAKPLVIEAPGQSITIRAASVNFEEA